MKFCEDTCIPGTSKFTDSHKLGSGPTEPTIIGDLRLIVNELAFLSVGIDKNAAVCASTTGGHYTALQIISKCLQGGQLTRMCVVTPAGPYAT